MKNFLTTKRRYKQNSGHSSKRINKISSQYSKKEKKLNGIISKIQEKFIDFWTKLWSIENEGNDNPEWLHDIQETFCEIVKEIDTSDIVITEKEQWDAIRKNRTGTVQGLI